MSDPRWFRIYEKLPIPLQNLACTLAGIKMRRQRHNRTFRKALEFLEESQWWPLDRQREYQNEKLRWMIRHAYETVPYYREVFRSLKLTPEDIRSAADLPKLPILEKRTVRERYEDLLSQSWPERRRVHEKTGGTTGTSMQIVTDTDTTAWHWAVHWRHRGRFGARFGDPFVVFAGRSVVPMSDMNPPIWRRNLAMHQTYVCVHHMTRRNMPALVNYLHKRQVVYYCGYPSALYLLATYLLDNGIRLRRPPRVTFTGAETLLPHQRRIMGQAFETDVGDHYAATEACVFASECERHSYHMDMEYAVMEFLPLEGAPSTLRRIIGTGLCNPAMPLIRYNLGDLATLPASEGKCPCGRAAPLVEKIDGRIESYVITPDGRQLGRLDFLFKKSGGIDEAQLVQDALDHLTVKLVRNRDYNQAQEAGLWQDLRHYLGDAIRIDLDYVDAIPRESNGKFRQIVSAVYRDRHQDSSTSGGLPKEC